MKCISTLGVLLLVLGVNAFAQQPPADLAQKGVDALNTQNFAYFEKALAPEVVWLDEDGHAITGKDAVLSFIKRKFAATPAKKITATNIKTGNTSDAAWASFQYTVDAGAVQKKGLNSTVFKKAGNDWQIVLVHGAMNAAGH